MQILLFLDFSTIMNHNRRRRPRGWGRRKPVEGLFNFYSFANSIHSTQATQRHNFGAFRSLRAGHIVYALTQTLPITSIKCLVFSVRVLIYKSAH